MAMSHFSVLVIHKPEESLDELLLPWMENCCDTPPLEYMEFYPCEDCDVDELTGERGYWQNPDARWDWYEVGGRFEGALPLKNGGRSSSARLGEIEFGTTEASRKKALEFWEKAVAGDLAEGEAVPFCWPPASALRAEYGSAEEYAELSGRFVPWAVIVDGVWAEQEKMGWFGLGDGGPGAALAWRRNFYDRFIMGLDPTLMATIVDCHI